MEKEDILRALDIIDDGFLIVDRDFVIEYANQTAKKLLRRDELVGVHSYEAIWGRQELEGKCPSFMTFETDKPASAEKTLDDGSCLHVRSYPVDERHLAITIWDITDYVSLERRLEISGSDSVTGLRGGNIFAEDLEKELDRAKRAKSGLTLVLLELGTIESLHEQNHEDVLKKIAEIVVETARNYDLSYRFKSDTFGILMPHCSIDGAKKTADRILSKITGRIGNVNPSVGISSSEIAFTGRDILRLAERALYVAKHRGGNTCVIG